MGGVCAGGSYAHAPVTCSQRHSLPGPLPQCVSACAVGRLMIAGVGDGGPVSWDLSNYELRRPASLFASEGERVLRAVYVRRGRRTAGPPADGVGAASPDHGGQVRQEGLTPGASIHRASVGSAGRRSVWCARGWWGRQSHHHRLPADRYAVQPGHPGRAQGVLGQVEAVGQAEVRFAVATPPATAWRGSVRTVSSYAPARRDISPMIRSACAVAAGGRMPTVGRPVVLPFTLRTSARAASIRRRIEATWTISRAPACVGPSGRRQANSTPNSPSSDAVCWETADCVQPNSLAA